MKVAFIEPVDGLERGFATDFHMVVPEALHLEKYARYYTGLDKDRNYVILDNGEADEETPSWDNLLLSAAGIGAHEIVVPDVMGDAQGTQRRALDFGNHLKDYDKAFVEKYNWMGVAHGTTHAEVVGSIQFLGSLDYINVLGLPRIISNDVHKYIRCTIAETPGLMEFIVARFPGGIHCLGASRFFKEALLLADLPVRSIDTSFVASMSLAARNIRRDPWCGRPKNFWTQLYEERMINIADFNHDEYRFWCEGVNASQGGL